MNIRLNPNYLTYDDVRRIAGRFLKQYEQRIGPPVEIEEIAELDMGLVIVPVPELLEKLDIDGFTSSDLSQILVDESVFNHPNDNRYRFTIAHELGHVEMHRDIFARFRFAGLDEYKKFIEEVDENDYGWLEQHAYWFAGLVLVPSPLLNERFEQELSSARLKHSIQIAREQGLERNDYIEHVTKQIAEHIGRYFNVSSQVVVRRLGYDKLIDKIP